eukprot:COSAG01_NODE_123_length_25210_cov_348.799434_18_plen_100_part_00
MLLRAVFLFSATVGVCGHGSVVNPPPRNAVDRDLAPWNSTILPWEQPGATVRHPPNVEQGSGWCPVPSREGKVSGQNGQACFWFCTKASLSLPCMLQFV